MKIEFYHTFKIPEKNINVEGQWDLNPTAPFIFDHVKVAGKSVIDIACRDGWYSFCFEKGMGARKVYALDLDDRLARRYIAKALSSQVEFIHANAFGLHRMQEKSFDVTFAGDVLCHIQDPVLFLKNIHHITKDEFYLVADVWPRFEIWYDAYPFKFTEKELFDVLKMAGFLEPTVLARYKIIGEYWRRRGSQSVRDVSLIRCKRNPAWVFPDYEGIIPQSGTENNIPELTHEVKDLELC